jgi:hypothetical protein
MHRILRYVYVVKVYRFVATLPHRNANATFNVIAVVIFE